MRQLRYSVAMSLDGFIAGPRGEYDWITHDPEFDFGALFRQFDTLLMGRRTFDLAQSQDSLLRSMKMKVVVVSTTLDAARHKDVTILSSGVAEAITALKAESGKDIWLFGGGVLFRSLLDAGLVDSVELAVSPVLLGSGVRLVPEGRFWPLRLTDCKTMPNSGIVMLKYAAGLGSDGRVSGAHQP
jgi:dihydrofolate reductase